MMCKVKITSQLNDKMNENLNRKTFKNVFYYETDTTLHVFIEKYQPVFMQVYLVIRIKP